MFPNIRDYSKSVDYLERAERTIPLGSQTFSKSRTQFPVGVSPLYCTGGLGPRITDIDGNSYIDFACSLGSVTQGYADETVNRAIEDQLRSGILFSMPHVIEAEVAERIVAMLPGAEKVRFGKNGSDATAGCIRLARAFTGRDRVAVCGYHGWQDWYIGSTSRDLGVPKATKELTSAFPYNDLDAVSALLESHPGEFAAIILEPVAFTEPKPGYLAGLKALAHKHSALLVFDEVVTGFRLREGSAQQRYGVVPDLTALGKGLANGMPLSAVAGRADVMKLMEEIFFSFTMGGEALSLAAAGAVLDKVAHEDSLGTIDRSGRRLLEGVQQRLERTGLDRYVSCIGQPCWSLFTFADAPAATPFELKTLFIQEAALRGIFNIGLHFLGAKHDFAVIDEALAAYDEIFPIIAEAAESGTDGKLNCEPLVPLFKVR
jgi:glutamate-1-semialdehyde 2,1-aminomutase